MYRKTCTLFLVILLASGCSPQPSETQKAVVGKDILGCLFLVNDSMDEDSSSLGEALSLLTKLPEISELKNKKWRLEVDDLTKDETIFLDFEHQGTEFSCSFVSDSDGKYEIQTVSRNSEEVYNKEVNEKIKKKKAEIAEQKRVEEIKQWKERSYSNVSHKFYEKRHVASDESYGEPTLNVVCDPEGIKFEYDDSSLNINGRRDFPFIFQQKSGPIEGKFDLASSGRIGKWRSNAFGGDVYHDASETHRFLDLLETSSSVQAAGNVFDVDDFQQVPCLRTRKEDLAQRREQITNYLAAIKTAAGQNVSRDALTKESIYYIYGETDRLSSGLFGNIGSQIVGMVKHDESKGLTDDAFMHNLLIFGRMKSEDRLGSVEVLSIRGSEKYTYRLRCQYNYQDINSDGYANEICESSDLSNKKDLRNLTLSEAVRVSADGNQFDTNNATEEQQKYLNDIVRIATLINLDSK